jgi:flagellar basal-body rod protein FlgG
MHSAASGMEAHQFALDTIANNLANASTTSFKRTRTNFEDLFYEHVKVPGAESDAGQTGVGISVGLGTRVESTTQDFRQGSLLETGADFDAAIVGEGFFQVQDGAGLAYTRAGNFTLNSNGQMVLASADSGRLLQPAITIPVEAQAITITGDGRVTYLAPDNSLIEAGQIQTFQFPNNAGLLQKGENLYVETIASGAAAAGTPGTDGYGQLRHRFLEASNVEPVRELVDLIKTQRNFELNSQTIQAADQMLQLISNLRRF